STRRSERPCLCSFAQSRSVAKASARLASSSTAGGSSGRSGGYGEIGGAATGPVPNDGTARREDPAMNLRERAKQGRGKLNPGALGRLAQAAVAAGISWELALQLPAHGQPFFAPIGAVIALGAERGTRGRQAIQMMTGVSVGIVIGAVVLAIAGAGAWQIVVASAVALGIAAGAGGPPAGWRWWSRGEGAPRRWFATRQPPRRS